MKGTDIFPQQIPLMSKEGARLAKRSGQMTPWNQTTITSVQLDGDPWKTRWTKMQPGDRPTLEDWMVDAHDGDPDDPGTQAEQETRHNNADDDEESEEPVERKKSNDRSIAKDKGKCTECRLADSPRRGYAVFQGEIR